MSRYSQDRDDSPLSHARTREKDQCVLLTTLPVMVIDLTYPESTPPWLQTTLSVTILIVGLCLVLFSCRWVGRDAERRGKSGCLVALLVLLTWPLGLILWLFFRPDSRSKWSRLSK
jgi:hypothetical protein